jgi:uncharacterized membrane protein YhhN
MISALSAILAIVSITELIFVKRTNHKGRMITKPLLMPLVICIYITAASNVNYIIITALIFGFIGDVLLLGPDLRPVFFKAGLASFLAGHIFYICAFLFTAGTFSGISLYYYLFLLPFIAGFIFVMVKLWPELGPMKIPVMIYAVIIIIMSFTALARGYHYNGCRFWCPFAGSLFFLISDFSIAYNHFIKKTRGDSVLVMSTYILAQVLIMAGFIN